MENKNSQDTFNYTYSAREQKEIQNIRNKYSAPAEQEDNLERLRRLDAGVTQKGTVVSLVIGILSTTVLGVGMCCCMVWDDLGMWMFALGILVGVIGIIGICLAYPLYMRITKKEREKIAPEILRLTDQLMK
ncbi:MAG: hypothetical protein IJW44_00605 [Clostridia bacterium]|nr:hypothetical protein [Clostridia bacterium]